MVGEGGPSLAPGREVLTPSALHWVSHSSSESHHCHKLCQSQRQCEPGEDEEAGCEQSSLTCQGKKD